MKSEIKNFCLELEKEYDLIPAERKTTLELLSGYLSKKYAQGLTPELIVICTHNSRRSHIGQIWLKLGAEHFNLPTLHSYSGGTEATAFNFRAVAALKRFGFDIAADDLEAENPNYQIKWSSEMEAQTAFSKKYDAKPNPTENFAALMVCTSADEGCPVVQGCDFRLAIPYDDPKAFDDTDLEGEKYEERIRQIGREFLYALSKVK